MTSVPSAFPASDGSPRTPLCIGVARLGSVLVLAVRGEVDMVSAELLTSTAEACLAEHGGRIDRLVLDLAHVSFLNVSGYRALCAIGHLARDAGCARVIREPSPAVRRVLELLPSLD